MEVLIVENAAVAAMLGAGRVAELLAMKPSAVLGLATGSTPIAIYQELVSCYRRDQISFADVVMFNLDEYVGLTSGSPQSYRSFMDRELFDHVDISSENTHFPACHPGDNPRLVGSEYEAKIIDAGGIDLQILGIGRNGHIGFNEPGSSLSSRTRIKTLTKSTVYDNSRLFSEGDFQSHLAMTMGIATILEARRTILFATGEHKAAAVRDAIEGPVSARCQASSLQLHERATFVLDEAAASLLEYSDYYQWANAENEPLMREFGHFYELQGL